LVSKFTSALLSSEVFPAGIALAISMAILPRDTFDLRVLGTVHLAILLFALWLLFRPTSRLPKPARVALSSRRPSFSCS
jgi:hypothetical protein